MPLNHTHTFFLQPKRQTQSTFFSDAQCPCQLTVQKQERWPRSATRMAQRICHRSAKSSGRAAAQGLPLHGQPTSTDGPVAHVARFAGAAVSLDGVGADGILITVVLPAATFVVLCLQGEKERHFFIRWNHWCWKS